MNKFVIIAVLSGVLSGCAVSPLRPVLDAEALKAGKQVMEAGTESLRKGNLAEATEFFNFAYQLGKQAEAIDGLGCIAFKQGDLDQAIKHFQVAIDRAPTLSEAYGHIAVVLDERGDIVGAEQYFQQGLAIKPSDLVLRYEYAQFLARHGNKDDSRILMEQVRSMVPKVMRFSLKGS